MHRFLEGPAGTGKTTRALELLGGWLADGIPAHEILVLVPQRTLGHPYQRFLEQTAYPNAAALPVVTFTGLAQRALSLYWPLVAAQVIPDWDGREPTFLNIETSQYYMAQFVEPQIQAGFFEGVSLPRPRIVAQTLDNLSKAAVNRFTLEEVAERLSAAWVGHSSRQRIYETTLTIARDFREYCLKNALLDFSLQIDLFNQQVLENPSFAENARAAARYLIVDNLEENFPVTFDFIAWLWSSVEDACYINDTQAGYRLFLGAAPDMALDVRAACDEVETFTQPIDQRPEVTALGAAISYTLGQGAPLSLETLTETNPAEAFSVELLSFYPQMIDWTAQQVIRLVKEENVPTGQIVILAPYLGDSLRFSLFHRLEEAGVPYVSHRPSRALRDEPVTQAALALMSIAYGGWERPLARARIARALSVFIGDFDPIRADLLTQIVYRGGELTPFEAIKASVQQRITYTLGGRYESLRAWLLAFREQAASAPPDYFLRRLFEFASQPGYGLYGDVEAARVVSELVESAIGFRSVIAPNGVEDWQPIARDYAELVGAGVLAAAHTTAWSADEADAVFIAPAYTFLMRNRFVDYQFWLDIGSNAWVERLDQPLTHPYVLRRDFDAGQVWTDMQEKEQQTQVLHRVLLGLTRRCRQHIYMTFTDLGEQGYEQRGLLLKVLNRITQLGESNGNPLS